MKYLRIEVTLRRAFCPLCGLFMKGGEPRVFIQHPLHNSFPNDIIRVHPQCLIKYIQDTVKEVSMPINGKRISDRYNSVYNIGKKLKSK